MTGAVLIIFSLLFFVIGYRFWGRYVSNKLGINPQKKTPAHTLKDGIDYVPTKPAILLGHHFSSIAGAAPIIGPIAAASFGWSAVALWILFGGLFMGAVHDFSSLIISVRHGGRSLGEVIESSIGKTSKRIFLIFVYATLLLVIAVFTNAVSKLFHAVPEAGTASLLFILLAFMFGLSVYRLKFNFIISTLISLLILAGFIYIGYLFPLKLSINMWKFILLAYITIASVLPVWILLQPRDFLNSFILYVMLFALVAGIIFVNPELKLHATPVLKTSRGPILPILFVTVACGALSGFHSLVASGTTSKQLDNESQAQSIGFGAMLIESMLAMGALITAAMMSNHDLSSMLNKGAVTVFSSNSAQLISHFGISFKVAQNFMALAVAAFALTSLDTATRLGRFAFQEFFFDNKSEKQSLLANNRFISTIITVVLGGTLVFSGSAVEIWPVFGAANQLLAALAFMAITVWLIHMKKPTGFTAIPGIFIYLVTIAALGWNIYFYTSKGKYPLSILSGILIVLALFLGIEGVKIIRQTDTD